MYARIDMCDLEATTHDLFRRVRPSLFKLSDMSEILMTNVLVIRTAASLCQPVAILSLDQNLLPEFRCQLWITSTSTPA